MLRYYSDISSICTKTIFEYHHFANDLLVLDCPHVKIIRIPLDTVPAREEYCYHVAVEITSDLSDPATASEISNAIIGIEEDFERFAWMTF